MSAIDIAPSAAQATAPRAKGPLVWLDMDQTELDNAKSYLTGSYALRFDTNSKIASQLLAIMVEGLGVDYEARRATRLESCRHDVAKNPSFVVSSDIRDEHFASAKGKATALMVSGRTFPVEQRYRAFEESREFDQDDAIVVRNAHRQGV